jgi:hypothetical protein
MAPYNLMGYMLASQETATQLHTEEERHPNEELVPTIYRKSLKTRQVRKEVNSLGS